jgi:hypothetical protein
MRVWWSSDQVHVVVFKGNGRAIGTKADSPSVTQRLTRAWSADISESFIFELL